MVETESRAINIARTHVESWSHHEWDATRNLLADDVKLFVSTTMPGVTPVNSTGADAYMEGMTYFGKGVVPGTAKVVALSGDDNNALLLVTLRANLGRGGGISTLYQAHCYLIDNSGQIMVEQVVYYGS